MKNALLLAIVVFAMAACQSPKQAEQTEQPAENTQEPVAEATTEFSYYGSEIDVDGAVDAGTVKAQLSEKSEMDVKLSGTINQCCRKKGCWMTVASGDGEEIMVRFKDYGFFVPKDADGHEVVFEGRAYWDTVSVDDLRHYAEDAGKSEEEIAAITEPEYKVSFEATGVAIKGYTPSETEGEGAGEGEEMKEEEHETTEGGEAHGEPTE